jgi:hypothetical protein
MTADEGREASALSLGMRLFKVISLSSLRHRKRVRFGLIVLKNWLDLAGYFRGMA